MQGVPLSYHFLKRSGKGIVGLDLFGTDPQESVGRIPDDSAAALHFPVNMGEDMLCFTEHDN